MAVEIHGYQYSVYSWIARLALHEKGVAYSWVEIDPFAENVPASYLAMHPFKRVPALAHGGFAVYETGAITRYVDEAFEGPKLQRTDPRERARCNQIMSIVDSYAYWPLVRQVFSHRVFRPRMRRPADENEVQRGLDAAPRVLAALERIAGDAVSRRVTDRTIGSPNSRPTAAAQMSGLPTRRATRPGRAPLAKAAKPHRFFRNDRATLSTHSDFMRVFRSRAR